MTTFLCDEQNLLGSSQEPPLPRLDCRWEELIRIALNQIISAAPQLRICAATGDYDEVPELIRRYRPHLMIGEPFQSGRAGITWVKDLQGNHPETKILVASSSAESLIAERILRAGGSGYWMKNGSSAELLNAIDTVLNGNSILARQSDYLPGRDLSVDRPNASKVSAI